MEDCLEELEEAQPGPDWWGGRPVSIGILVYRTCPVEPSLLSSLLAEAGSLQVLPGCLEDREGDIFLTPPSLRVLAREEEGDDEVLAGGLQSLALEQESVLVTADLSVAGSEAGQSPAPSRVRRSEAGQSLEDPEPDVAQSGINTETWNIEREQSREYTEMWQSKCHTGAWQSEGNTSVQCEEGRQSSREEACQVDRKVRTTGVEQCRGDSEVWRVKPLELEVARLASVEVVGGEPSSFILRMADSGYKRRLDQALRQVSSVQRFVLLATLKHDKAVLGVSEYSTQP